MYDRAVMKFHLQITVICVILKPISCRNRKEAMA